jgi:hypothetical protein
LNSTLYLCTEKAARGFKQERAKGPRNTKEAKKKQFKQVRFLLLDRLVAGLFSAQPMLFSRPVIMNIKIMPKSSDYSFK